MQQQSQYILRQFLRCSGIKRGQLRMAHQYIRLTDEQVDEFHRQIGLNQAALLQGVEKPRIKAYFLRSTHGKPLQLQIGVLFDVAQEGGGIEFFKRLFL